MNKPGSIPSRSLHRVLSAAEAFRRRDGADDDDAPTLLGCAKTLRARKWTFIAITLALAAPAIAVIANLTPVYRATASVLIEATRGKVVSIEEVYGGASANREYFQTQAEFLRSRDVSLRAIRELGLVEHPAFDPRQRKPGAIEQVVAAVRSRLRQTESDTREEAELEAIVLARVQASLDVTPVRLSQLVQVHFEAHDPKLASAVANAVAESYIRSDLDARFRMTQTAVTWLNEQLETLRKKVEASERKLQAYRETAGLIASKGSSEGAGNARQLDEFAQRLVQARVARTQLEQVYSQLKPGAPNRFEVPVVFNNPSVARAREAESGAERRLAEMRDRTGTAHPMYQAAQAELEAARSDRRRQSEAVVASVERELESARAAERSLEAALERARGTILDINRKEIALDALEREAAGDRQLYQTFLSRVKETTATADFRTPAGRIIDPALPPVSPSKPPKLQLSLLALMLSAVLAALVTVQRERQHRIVRTSDDVERLLHAPLIATVPIAANAASRNMARIQADDRKSLFAESVRTLLTGTQLSLVDVDHPVVGFTSSVPGEGKTTLAIGFAIEQARTRRVLLVDADLHRSRIARALGLPDDAPGLRALLSGGPADRSVHRLSDLGLYVLPTGGVPENPLDLLVNPNFGKAIAALRREFDMVVIDTPPVELVSDALLIGRELDGLVYVVKASATPVPIVERGLNRVRAAGIPLIGVVLNAHDFGKAGRYYGDTSAHTRYSYEASTRT